MSGSENEFGGWGKKENDRDQSSPYRPESKRLHSNDSFDDEPVKKRAKVDDNRVATQPPMLLFKHFLNQQEDDLLVEDAMRKYNEYKETFACEQLLAFFETHKEEEWFKEKYHPDFINASEKRRLENVEKRRAVFEQLKSSGWLNDISIHINYQDNLIKLLDAVCIFLEGGDEHDLKVLDRKMYRPDSPGKTEIKIDIKQEINSQLLSKDDFIDEEMEKPVDQNKDETTEETGNSDKNEISNETGDTSPNERDEEVMEVVETEGKVVAEPRPLHKTLSIFLKNIHPNVFRFQLEEIVKQFPGYLRIALQEPLPERKFMRRGWITFAGHTELSSALWQLNKHRLADTELGAVANKDTYQRVRPVDTIVNHRAVMRQDVKYAAKLVSRFDKRRKLWTAEVSMEEGNPILKNITEFLVDEGSYEEEAYLGGNINHNLAITGGGDPSNIQIEEDLQLAKVLDRLILYLRVVHSFDYYSATEYDLEDDLPSKCGLVHVRGNPLHPDQRFTQRQLEEHMRQAEARAQLVLDSIDNLDFQVAARLGVKGIEESVEKFITDNTKEISSDKWLCPLSGKKFKGPEFVRKHIFNKYADRVEHVRETVQFLNSYILDPRRPQLPEHPSNRPAIIIKGYSNFEQNSRRNLGRSNEQNGFNGGRGGYNMRGRGNYNNYRNNRNNYGDDNQNKSYHSRPIMNYNDMDR